MPLLKQFNTRFGVIRVTRSADGVMAYYQNGCFHSQSNKNGTSVCAYVHVINEIVRQSYARNVLIIGCAGGTLATMLRRLHCKVTVVDINYRAFVIARDYFKLPEDVRCVRRDGIAYLRTTRKHYDAIVVDVFGSNNAVPGLFRTEKFFQQVQNVLTPKGIMVMNVITANDKDNRADDIARNAQAAGIDVTLFDWPGEKDRNTILIGNILRRIHIPSGKEPAWIKPDLHGIIRRKPQKRAVLRGNF
jgi:spermidine synthase